MVNGRVELISQAEYARRRGVAKSAVAKAVSEGRMSLIDGKVDPQVADIQWERNTRARAGSGRSTGHVSAPGADLLDGAVEEGAQPASPPAQPPADGYSAARARREHAEAATAEIQLAKLRGELCSTQDVARAGFEAARELRDALESSVNSLAAELASLGTADACAAVLRRHNRAIQDILAKALREKMSLRVEGV